MRPQPNLQNQSVQLQFRLCSAFPLHHYYYHYYHCRCCCYCCCCFVVVVVVVLASFGLSGRRWTALIRFVLLGIKGDSNDLFVAFFPASVSFIETGQSELVLTTGPTPVVFKPIKKKLKKKKKKKKRDQSVGSFDNWMNETGWNRSEWSGGSWSTGNGLSINAAADWLLGSVNEFIIVVGLLVCFGVDYALKAFQVGDEGAGGRRGGKTRLLAGSERKREVARRPEVSRTMPPKRSSSSAKQRQ